MNITDLQRAKDAYTGKASDVVRQFAFAGIAVIWLLRVNQSTGPIPQALIPIMALFGISLASDLLQYAVSSAIWTIYYRHKLKDNLAESTEFSEPKGITLPAYILFVAKIVACLIGWAWLARYLVVEWKLA